MSDRKATLWISDAQAQAARCNWQRFCQTMRHGPAEHHAASHGYLMGVIDTLGIRSPAALVDALSKITAQTILTEAEEQATIARTLQSAADLVEDLAEPSDATIRDALWKSVERDDFITAEPEPDEDRTKPPEGYEVFECSTAPGRAQWAWAPEGNAMEYLAAPTDEEAKARALAGAWEHNNIVTAPYRARVERLQADVDRLTRERDNWEKEARACAREAERRKEEPDAKEWPDDEGLRRLTALNHAPYGTPAATTVEPPGDLPDCIEVHGDDRTGWGWDPAESTQLPCCWTRAEAEAQAHAFVDSITAPHRARAEAAERACAKAVREFYGCKDERDEARERAAAAGLRVAELEAEAAERSESAARLLASFAPCRACGWACSHDPARHEEPPIVRGALDAQEAAEKRAGAALARAEQAERERDTLRALLERCATVFRAGKMFPENESNLLTEIAAALHRHKEQP